MEADEFEPTEEEIQEYATWLGMDPETEKDLLWIAMEGLKAPVPDGWIPCNNENEGEMYFIHTETGEKSWDHPCDQHYRNLYKAEKEKLLLKTQKVEAPPADQGNGNKNGADQDGGAHSGKSDQKSQKEPPPQHLTPEFSRSIKSFKSQSKGPIDETRVELFKEMIQGMLKPATSFDEKEAVLQKVFDKGKDDPNMISAINEICKDLEEQEGVQHTPESRNDDINTNEGESPESLRLNMAIHMEGDTRKMYLDMATAWVQTPELGEEKIIENLSQIPQDDVYAPALCSMALENNLPKVAEFIKCGKMREDFPARKGKSPGPDAAEDHSLIQEASPQSKQSQSEFESSPENQRTNLNLQGLSPTKLPKDIDWVDSSHLVGDGSDTMRTPEPILGEKRAATLIQTMIRGVLARSYTVELLYMRAYKALTLIQAIARGFLVRKSLWNRKGRMKRSSSWRQDQGSPGKPNERESWMMTWQRIVDKTPSYSDKVRFWQTVIEVKRVSANSTNVEVMAALFEAKGNVQRAITILSSEEHAWRLKRALKGQQIPSYLLPVQKLPPRAQRLRRRRSRQETSQKGQQRSKDIFPLIESIFMGETVKPTKLSKVKRGPGHKKPGYARSIGKARNVNSGDLSSSSQSDGSSP